MADRLLRGALVALVLGAAGAALTAGVPVFAGSGPRPAGLLSSPLPLPIPLPSLPPILPGPSPTPSPSPSPSPAAVGGSGGGASHGSSVGGGGFGPSGIVSAYAATQEAGPGSTSPATTPVTPAGPPAVVPPVFFGSESGGAVPSAVPPLLIGLLLVSMGLWLMAMRHRREALRTAALERTKTDFLNLASHELRGPLTILKGYMSTAREGHFGQLPDAFASRLPTVQSQLGRMELLVEQMLETARLDAGRPELQREPADLRRIVRNAVPEERLEGTDHRVDIDVPDFPVVVDVDEKRIEQVLRNLIDNAIKYSDPPARVRIRLLTDAGGAQVDVTDSGHGIAPEDMRRLFSRFGRLVTEQNSHVPGVGLGLYLGRTVARMHGGELDATSELGRGSTFTLTLPLEADAASPARTADAGPLRRAVRSVARRLPSKARGSAS